MGNATCSCACCLESKCALNLLHSVNGVRAWTHGGLEARSRSGDMAYGGTEVWRHGGLEARYRRSDMDVWRSEGLL